MNLQQSLKDDIRCEMSNHFHDKIQYVCVFDKCEADQRLCCSYCKFRFHNKHIQQLVKINDFTNKIYKDGQFLNIKLSEKKQQQKGQVNPLIDQKIDKRIHNEMEYVNLQMQNVISAINEQLTTKISSLLNHTDEITLGQSVFQLQTNLQHILNTPWNQQSNQTIHLMALFYRGDQYAELLLEDEQSLTHTYAQSTTDAYLAAVHAKLNTLFKHIQEQIHLIFKESFPNRLDKQRADQPFSIKRKEKESTYPSIRLLSTRHSQNAIAEKQEQEMYQDINLQIPSQRNRLKNHEDYLNFTSDNERISGDLDLQSNKLNTPKYTNNNQQESTYNKTLLKPKSILFKQLDNNQQQRRQNSTLRSTNIDSLDEFTARNILERKLNQEQYPNQESERSQKQEDPYIHYSRQLQQRGGQSSRGRQSSLKRDIHNNSQFHNQHNPLDFSLDNQYSNRNLLIEQYDLNGIEEQYNEKSNTNRKQLNTSLDSPTVNRQITSQSSQNQQYNQTLIIHQYDTVNTQNPINNQTQNSNQSQQMSIIQQPQSNQESIPQTSKLENPQENSDKKQTSHIIAPPKPNNFEEYKLKKQKHPLELIRKPIETDSQKIKANKPQNNWLPQQSLPINFPHLQLLSDAQQKWGYLDIQETNNGQSRLQIHKSEKGDLYYDGEWLQGKRNGKGTLYMEDGSVYEGEWKNDEMTGQGRLIQKQGEIYEGDFVQQKFDGKGYIRHANGTEYIGNWKNDKFEGEGRKTWSNGSYYDGYFKENKREGEGVFMWMNGSFYKGQFFNNQFHGKGIYQWDSGRLYVGEWIDGKMEGNGKDILEQGYIYEGQYQKDQKHGYGVFTFNQNKIFKGNWSNDRPHGEGAMIENGVEMKGIWEHGQLIQKL